MVKKCRCTRGQARDLVFALLKKMGGSPARGRLACLWRQWNEVMGEDLAGLASPLGSRGKTLLIAAENAIQLQELHFYCDELRERANAFLGCEYFESARIELIAGREGMPPSGSGLAHTRPPRLCRPIIRPTGKFLAGMNSDSAVARCYARFTGQNR